MEGISLCALNEDGETALLSQQIVQSLCLLWKRSVHSVIMLGVF